MKVNELSNLTGINIETIRMYRNDGLLHPTKLTNGYYEYSMQDYASLLHLKKLRSFDFSINDIKQSEQHDSIDEYMDRFTHVEDQLLDEIERIKQKIEFIHFERNHVLSTISTADINVSIDQSIDEKIDLYPPFDNDQSFIPTTDPNFFLYTTTPIFISKDILNGPVEDKVIETKVGIGTYRSIYEKMDLMIPNNSIIVPNGRCISQIIRMKDLTHINIKDLEPMINYAKEINMPFISDSTGYLAGISYEEGKPVFIMRIRACIEKNNVIHPDRIK